MYRHSKISFPFALNSLFLTIYIFHSQKIEALSPHQVESIYINSAYQLYIISLTTNPILLFIIRTQVEVLSIFIWIITRALLLICIDPDFPSLIPSIAHHYISISK